MKLATMRNTQNTKDSSHSQPYMEHLHMLAVHEFNYSNASYELIHHNQSLEVRSNSSSISAIMSCRFIAS